MSQYLTTRDIIKANFPYDVCEFLEHVAGTMHAHQSTITSRCVLLAAETKALGFAHSLIFFSNCVSQTERRNADAFSALRAIGQYAEDVYEVRYGCRPGSRVLT